MPVFKLWVLMILFMFGLLLESTVRILYILFYFSIIRDIYSYCFIFNLLINSYTTLCLYLNFLLTLCIPLISFFNPSRLLQWVNALFTHCSTRKRLNTTLSSCVDGWNKEYPYSEMCTALFFGVTCWRANEGFILRNIIIVV